MERLFDYSKGKVDRKNKKRIIFINRMAYLMQNFSSTSKEVNELIDWLYYLSEKTKFHNYFVDFSKDYYNFEPVKHQDKSRIIQEVWINDMYLYSYAILLYEYNYWPNKDVLTEIIRELYFKLNKIIYPSDESHRDYENIKYYVEVDYVDEER